MDTKAITLSTNHVVTLKKSLTYRAERAITEALMGDTTMSISPGDKKSIGDQVIELKYRNVAAYQDEALRHLLVSVMNPDKTEADDPFEAIMELPSEVAAEVMAVVDEMTKSKKKSLPSN